MTTKRIIVVDDDPDSVHHLFPSDDVLVVHPRALSKEDLANAEVVLVDHHLKGDCWPERESYPFSCQAMDGIALAGIILGHLRGMPHYPPSAVALLSNELNLVTPGIVSPPEHIAARASGLHWAFDKNAKGDDPHALITRVEQLRLAVGSLPRKWPDDTNKMHSLIQNLLGLSDDLAWRGGALMGVLRCKPPINELADWSSGLAFIRWLSQFILPYPTVIVGDASLAIKLGVDPAWLIEQLNRKNSLSERFDSIRYKGILKDFSGRRWWVAGLDSLLWNEHEDIATSNESLYKWLEKLTESTPIRIAPDCTTIVNKDLQLSTTVAKYADCVRLAPDHWLAYADQPYALTSDASNDNLLKSFVIQEDIERLTNA
jgi:hypothetical protein